MNSQTLVITIASQQTWLHIALVPVAAAVILGILSIMAKKNAVVYGYSVLPALFVAYAIAYSCNPPNMVPIINLIGFIVIAIGLGILASFAIDVQLETASNRNKARAYLARRYEEECGD